MLRHKYKETILDLTYQISTSIPWNRGGLLHGVVGIDVAHLVGEQSSAYDVAFIDCEGGYPYPVIPDLFEYSFVIPFLLSTCEKLAA